MKVLLFNLHLSPVRCVILSYGHIYRQGSRDIDSDLPIAPANMKFSLALVIPLLQSHRGSSAPTLRSVCLAGAG